MRLERAMKLPQTGGCQCGEIRYEVTEPRSWSTRAIVGIASD
jgi:hypothetical protein